MPTTTISSKGQITLPASLLRERHLAPGTQLEVVATTDAIVLVAAGESLVTMLAGATAGIYGDPSEYIEHERTTWTSTD